jgi:superfamily II DNA/RNA helicase
LKSKNSCPLCRQNVDTKALIYITKDDTKAEKEEEKALTKEKTIINIIKNKPKGKFIVYSSHDETFGTIKRLLKGNKISFAEIKGRIDSMQRRIEKFRKGKIQVIFLNSKFNGAGIDLVEATDLIIYHKMSDDTLQQILGRPNRIGRTESLQAHHLLYK